MSPDEAHVEQPESDQHHRVTFFSPDRPVDGGTMFVRPDSPWERCPDDCDGPECDCPPRVGGACGPCAAAHYATHNGTP